MASLATRKPTTPMTHQSADPDFRSNQSAARVSGPSTREPAPSLSAKRASAGRHITATYAASAATFTGPGATLELTMPTAPR